MSFERFKIEDEEDLAVDEVSTLTGSVAPNDIAIVGIATRLLGGVTLDELWRHFCGGRVLASSLPEKRLEDLASFLQAIGYQTPNFQKMAYLEDIAEFDHEFFNISPREAMLLDPQQRLFLENVWQVIEDAGYGGPAITGSNTGIYLGIERSKPSYRDVLSFSGIAGEEALPGNTAPVIASRISHILDLKGPTMLVDTACSSSLVALHLACTAILTGDCDQAIVGGLSIHLMPPSPGSFSAIMSPSGVTRAFDDSSDGTSGGEGVITLFIKRASAAFQNGDHIYALIKGTAINSDGRSIGITAPNADAQADVIEQAWKKANVLPNTIDYLEAHGTGTKIGDPVEIEGLKKAFERYTTRKQFCCLSTVKANIGHLGGAAGLAGVLGAVLALKHKTLPPLANFKRPNRLIGLADSPFYVNLRPTPWPEGDSPRRCGVSSFGMSGTNAHVVLQESPAEPEAVEDSKEPSLQLFVLSAKTLESLEALARKHLDHLLASSNADIGDICFTCGCGRSHHPVRLATVAQTTKELARQLSEALEAGLSETSHVKIGQAVLISPNREPTQSHEITAQRAAQLTQDAEELIKQGPASREALCAIGDLYTRGAQVPFELLFSGQSRRRVSLPAYSFSKTRCWPDIHPKDIRGSSNIAPRAFVGNRPKAAMTEVALRGRPSGSYTDTEQLVANAWSTALGYSELDILASYLELGGDSLFAAKIVTLINKKLEVGLKVRDLLSKITIRDLARHIDSLLENQEKTSSGRIPRAPELDAYQVSFAEHRYYVLWRLAQRSTAYNIPFATTIEGPLDIDRVRQAFLSLVERHDSLRTSYHLSRDQVMKRVHSSAQLDFELGKDETTDPVEFARAHVRPFDLSRAPLVRIFLNRRGEDTHDLVVDMHHIISDGVSHEILFEEFLSLYSGHTLPKIKVRYVDFSHWQRTNYQNGAYKDSERFWLDLLKGPLPTLDFPTDRARPEKRSFVGDVHGFRLPRQLVTALGSLSSEHGSTLFMTLYATYFGLLHRYTDQEDIVIGTIGAGREHESIERTVGAFANFLPVRLRATSKTRFTELLELSRETLLKVFDHQNYPFDRLVDQVSRRHAANRNPIYDTMLVLQNQQSRNEALLTGEDLRFRPITSRQQYSTLDFKVDFFPGKDGTFECQLEYSTELFDKTSMELLGQDFLALLGQIIADPEKRLCDYALRGRHPASLCAPPLGFDRRTQPVSAEERPGASYSLCASFTADPLDSFLSFWLKQVNLECTISHSPYHQVFQELLQPQSEFHKKGSVGVILFRLDDYIRDADAGPAEKEDILRQTAHQLEQVISSIEISRPTFLFLLPGEDTFAGGPLQTVSEDLYRRLSAAAATKDSLYVFDLRHTASEFAISAPFDAYADRQAHIPYTEAMFSSLAFGIARRLSGLHRPAFKVIALDCDNTLWKGVVGEDGVDGIDIGADHIALQEFIKNKKEQGFLLALCSKNNEADVWDVFDKRSEMRLKKDDFVGWRVNWEPKSANLTALADELNLGLSSFIFIDDSAVEISEVMHNSPEVYCLKLPSNSSDFEALLDRCWAFDKQESSEEDSLRTSMYKQETQRKQLRGSHISLDSFLEDLKLEVVVDEALPDEHRRLSQLSQRTNQFNTTTIRMSDNDVVSYAGVDGQGVWSVTARDKFGSYGVVGALYYRSSADTLIVDAFMMSCRALGRGVEHAVLACLKSHCERAGIAKVVFRYVKSPKNAPAARFFEELGLWEGRRPLEELNVGEELRVESEALALDVSRSAHIEVYFKDAVRRQKSAAPPSAPAMSDNGSPASKAAPSGTSWAYPLVNETSLLHLPIYKMSLLQSADDLASRFRTGSSATTQEIGHETVRPRNEEEALLLELWRSLFEKQGIGVTDDFFAIGGDSIKAVSFISSVRETFGKEIELADFFAAPTIRDVQRLLSTSPLSDRGAIPRAKPRKTYPVSSAQHRLFMLQHMERKNTSYNLPFVFSVDGALDTRRLEASIHQIVERHEILRTGFELSNGHPVMRIHDNLTSAMSYREIPLSEVRSALLGFVAPFDLSQPPLFRVSLFRVDESRYVLAFDIHHIITDGQSIDLLLGEILSCYAGKAPTSEPFQYRDFASWQKVRLESGALSKTEEFWASALGDELPTLSFPTDFPRPPVQSFAGDVLDFDLDRDKTDGLLRLSRENQCTLFMSLLACFNLALNAFTRQKDVVVGTTISGRNNPALRHALGLFIETLPIRCRWEDCDTFRELLRLTKRASLLSFENQDYPFKEMVSRYSDEHNLSRNPLFDVMLILQNFERTEMSFSGITVSPFAMDRHHMSKLDLTLEAIETRSGISFELEYCTALFTKETMRRFARVFSCTVDQVLENPDISLEDLYAEEPARALAAVAPFNETAIDVDLRTPISSRFSEAARRWPQNVACAFKDKTLTYEQLDKASDELAHRLSQAGVSSGALVALKLPRSLSIPVAVLAVMKLEAAYLPIDVKIPSKRCDFMTSDAKPSWLLSLDSAGEVTMESTGMQWDVRGRERLAYVVYTSGTTGQPKGVLVSSDNLISYVEAFNREFALEPTDTSMMQASFSFDWFVEEFFPTIVSGATFAIVPAELTQDPAGLSDFIRRQGVTVVSGPPVLLGELGKRDLGPTPRIFITGGDTVLCEQVSRLVKKDALVYNTYGPTETTVCATYHRIVDPRDPIPIGRPISNTRCHVLDPRLRPLPEGIAGELCIAGNGVSAGYLSRPEATSDRFVSLPFEEGPVYRTGDLAKWLPDGTLSFLGRLDDQVSIRGYRVEPKEVEAKLLAIEDISSAVVVPKPSRHRCDHLVAYLTASRSFDSGELRERLLFELPDYMIPSFFVQLEALPMTVHQKVDFKALPEPSLEKSGRAIVEPSGPMETSLVEILSNVLGVRPISMDDNFFSLGGDSLKAMTTTSRIEKELGRSVATVDFFQSPTIRSLAKAVGNSPRIDFQTIPKAAAAESYPLSSAQRRLWVLRSLQGVGTAYNISAFFEIRGDVDATQLAGAFRDLIVRHESLRTRFSTISGEPRQFICDPPETFTIERLSLKGHDIDRTLGDFIQPFDLETPPLLRVGILELEPHRHILVADIHHIVADGVSLVQLVKEAAVLYSGNHLEPLRIQYVDFAVWEGQDRAMAERESALEYWKNKFQDELPVLNLPTDHLRPASFDFKGGSHAFTIEKELTEKLKAFCAGGNKTLFSTLMAAFAITLSKLSGQQDLIIGTPSAGRPHVDLEQLVGMFATTLALRLKPLEEITFEGFANEVGAELLLSSQHQQVGLETIIDLLVKERDTSRNPLFDVMFVMQNNEAFAGPVQGTAAVDFQIEPYFIGHRTAKFDLTLEAFDFGESLHLILEFATALFDKSTIARYADYFIEVLKSGITDPQKPIADISMLPASERRQVVVEFNRLSPRFDSDRLLPQRFEEQVKRTPDKAAVSFNEETITYRELNSRSNQLAHYLRDTLGLGPGQIVGISIERSFEMIIAILGAMKSGAGYLAVDPTYPRDRVAHILADSAVEHLLIDRVKDLYADYEGNLLSVTADWSKIASCAADNPAPVNSPDDVLYVIYTSGTTGMPNGAMLSHDILSNLITWMADHTSIDTGSRCLQFTSINFCVSFQEIMGTLVSGGEVCLIDELKRQDIHYLMSFISDKGIENLYLPFSYMNFLFNESAQWLDFQHNLKNIITAGEQLKITESIRDFLIRNPEVALHNHYGSSEMHVVTSYTLSGRCVDDYPIPPAGVPISNTEIFILDDHLQPTPVGVFGELHVASRREILGYINAPELNESKLIHAPHICPDRRLYRSGDIGRWLPNGNIELKGRKDTQIKLHGFRIELSEIETKLLAIEGVKDCVVEIRKSAADEQILAAYVVLHSTTMEQVRAQLGFYLPHYMIPRLISLEALPLMPNGKVDRGALPDPAPSERSARIEPRDAVEGALTAIWAEILELEVNSISIDDNFFFIGGHSLRATKMLSVIAERLDANISLNDIFNAADLRSLAQIVRNAKRAEILPLTKAPRRAHYPLPIAQRSLLKPHVAEELDGLNNITICVELKGELDGSRLQRAMDQVVARHDSLRMSFELVDDHVLSRIAEGVQCEIRRWSASETALPMLIAKHNTRFDLEAAPLFRAFMTRLEEQRHVLVLMFDHIIFDGVSGRIFVDELLALYEGKQLEPVESDYIDYAQWHNRLLETNSLDDQEAYWKSVLNRPLPDLQLHPDHAPSNLLTRRGARDSLFLQGAAAKSLRDLAQSRECTLYIVLVAVLKVFVSRLTGLEDIAISSPLAARRLHPALERMIGMFAGTLTLRSQVEAGHSFDAFLSAVRAQTLEAFSNQDFPLESLLERDGIRGTSPLFFAFQNFEQSFRQGFGLTARRLPLEVPFLTGGLAVDAYEHGNDVEISIIYAEELFEQSTVRELLADLSVLIELFTKAPQTALEEVLSPLNDAFPSRRSRNACDLAAQLEKAPALEFSKPLQLLRYAGRAWKVRVRNDRQIQESLFQFQWTPGKEKLSVERHAFGEHHHASLGSHLEILASNTHYFHHDGLRRVTITRREDTVEMEVTDAHGGSRSLTASKGPYFPIEVIELIVAAAAESNLEIAKLTIIENARLLPALLTRISGNGRESHYRLQTLAGIQVHQSDFTVFHDGFVTKAARLGQELSYTDDEITMSESRCPFEHNPVSPSVRGELVSRFTSPEYGAQESIVALRDGKIVFEHIGDAPLTAMRPVHSLTKSITSLLVGIAIDQGAIPGLDIPYLELLQDRAAVKRSERLDRLTLRHVLSMQAGFEKRASNELGFHSAEDPVPPMLEVHMDQNPGAEFFYNNNLIATLAEVLEKATGQRADRFAKRHLFAPLGIENVLWTYHRSGFPMLNGGLCFSPLDVLKIGALIIERGLWEGRRIVSSAWIDESTKPQVEFPCDPEYVLTQYGLLWWLAPGHEGREDTSLIIGRGWAGQLLIIDPISRVTAVTVADNRDSRASKELASIDFLRASGLLT